jgi:haloacetate dehalogenase
MAQDQVEVMAALGFDRGRIAQLFDVHDTWRDRASHVRGRALACGHFPAEEAPGETADELLAFLT